MILKWLKLCQNLKRKKMKNKILRSRERRNKKKNYSKNMKIASLVDYLPMLQTKHACFSAECLLQC